VLLLVVVLLAFGVAGAGAAARSPRRVSEAPDAGHLVLVTEPANGPQPLYALIGSARHSLSLVMYELGDPVAEADLVADVRRGVRVRVILDGGSYDRALNRPAFRVLVRGGVRVRWAPREFTLTHEKAIIVDSREVAIMTLNLTSRYYATSRDFAVLDSQPADVHAIAATFSADWRAAPLTPTSGSGDLLWSPGAQASLLALINSASTSIDVEAEEMDNAAIEAALEAAARRGVAVQIVMTADSSWDDAFSALTAAGAQVRLYPANASLYIHAKLILVDGARLFLGSQNLSVASLTYNRELGIVTADEALIEALTPTFQSDFAGGQPFR
jgi:phosphatidylserine/phosphatidylglycerophosphate/cardiolipin synthase-like enzyme